MEAVQTIHSLNHPVETFPITLLPLIAHQPSTGTVHPQASAALTLSERDRLTMEHMDLVRFVARRISERLPQHVDFEDLVSAGILGLMDAVEKFNPARQVQFRSYAQIRIRGAILDSLRQTDWGSRELRRRGREIQGVMQTLQADLGRAPTEIEVATVLGIDLEEYQHWLGELKGLEVGSLNVERNEESGEEELAYVPGPSTNDPLYRCLTTEMQTQLNRAICALPERERLVLTLYYHEELTMKEIALTLDLGESRVSQIHSSAVLLLRSALTASPADAASQAKKTTRSKRR